VPAPPGRRSAWRRVLGDIDAHRPYLGSDEHTYIGPERRLGGFHAAMELIAREMNSLGITRERVAFIGTSMGAACAMVAGLMYGAGRIIVGAAPIRCGSALERFAGAKSRRKGAAPELIALAAAPGAGDPVEFLVLDLALRCNVQCRIDLLTSPTDYVTPSTHEFAAAAVENPLLRVHLHESDYELHGGVGEAFFPFLQRLLGQKAATLPA